MLEDIDFRSVVFILDGAFFLLLAAGFALRLPLVTGLWPWIEQPICSFFFAALLVAYGAGCLFLVRLKEWSASAGGSVALLIALSGFALQIGAAELTGHQTGLLVHAVVLAVIAATAGATLVANLKANRGPASPAPQSLRLMLRVMAALLYLVGLALLAGVHAILPWALEPQTRALLGWVIIGFSVNYAYTSLQGGWSAARVLLVGLVCYDAAIILPLLHHFTDVAPAYRLTLFLNVAVVATTASIAVFHLFVRPVAEVTKPSIEEPHREERSSTAPLLARRGS
jgi:hypothetical protein